MADWNPKIIVLTGASSGIGFEIARGVLASGAVLVPLLRDNAKSRAALLRWQAEFGPQSISPFYADLSDLDQVRASARAILARFPKVDVLINNAGLQRFDYAQTSKGLELTWTVNFLAPVLLTHMLLPALTRAGAGRIVNTGSMVERWGHLDATPRPERFDGHQAYYRSKLALTMFGYALARRLDGTGVHLATFEPGMVRTDFARDFKGFYRVSSRLFRPFMKSPHKAAQTPLDLALSSRPFPQAAYFRGRHMRQSSLKSQDLVRQEGLYLEACSACGIAAEHFVAPPKT